jgi:hypothetical protein
MKLPGVDVPAIPNISNSVSRVCQVYVKVAPTADVKILTLKTSNGKNGRIFLMLERR